MSLRRSTAGLLAAAVLVAGCGGTEDGPQPEADEETAAELLDRAKTVLDDTQSVDFTLESQGVPENATTVVGGDGTLARPSSFEGTLQVQAIGQSLDLEIVSVDGTVYAQLPFTDGWSEIDPQQFGFTDPGTLLDPETGISQFLSAAEGAEFGQERRVDGTVVQEVTAQVPGELVAQVLSNENPDEPADALFLVEPDSGQPIRAELTGPFYEAGQDATYTLALSEFGADVEITPPPTG